MGINQRLLQILADGSFHSGTSLGETLAISRSAVWKAISAIENSLGLEIHAVRGKGYRLAHAVELLDKKRLSGFLDHTARKRLSDIEIKLSIDSTNKYLMAQMLEGAPSGKLVLAEYQEQGRGRRGRSWISPFGTNLYLSLLWRFPHGPEQLSTLTLCVAAGLVQALTRMGGSGLAIKWPNDIYANGRKLAGILTEMRAESGGPSSVVVGVGVNVSMPRKQAEYIDQPWIDMESLLAERVSRNALAAAVIQSMLEVLSGFTDNTDYWLDEWRQHDWLKGESVEVHFHDRTESGIAMGIDEHGALRLLQGNREILCHAGEISLRRKSTG